MHSLYGIDAPGDHTIHMHGIWSVETPGINSVANWHNSTSVKKSTTFTYARYKHKSVYSYFSGAQTFSAEGV